MQAYCLRLSPRPSPEGDAVTGEAGGPLMGPGRPGRNGASSLSTETPGVLPGVSGFPGKLGGREPQRRGRAGGLLPLSGALGVHSAEAKTPWSV